MGWIVSPHGKALAIEMKIRSDGGRKGRFYKRFFLFILAFTIHPTEEIYFYLDSTKVSRE